MRLFHIKINQMKNYKLLTISLWMIAFMFCISNSVFAQPNYPRVSNKAELIYNDVENFVEAYSNLRAGVDTLKILNTYYFDKASIGLQEYIKRHSLSPELLRDAIQISPERYQKISDFVNNLDDFKPLFSSTLKEFGKVIPYAMYPPTYLLVGANRGIAQASRYGQLVTITRVLDDREKFIKLIVHELSHFQQAMSMGPQNYGALYSTPNNMLGLCLREGGAEFITYLVLGKITQEKALAYLIDNEMELKLKFQNDLKAQDSSYWLWESINQSEYPKLMGYAMGYQICSTYYNSANDKQKALKDILGITQSDTFLEMSGYFKN